MFDLDTFVANVTKELKAMQEMGMSVPAGVFTRAADKTEMADYVDTMSVADCAELLVELG